MRLGAGFLLAVSLSSGAGAAPAAAEDARVSFPVMQANQPSVYRSARSGSGEIWGIGYRDETVVLRWDGQAWVTEERAASWPLWAGPVGIVADPREPDAVISLWRTSNSREQGRGRYQLRRHRAGQPSVLLSDFVDPTGREDGGSAGPIARLTMDAWGRVWLTFRGLWLVSVPSDGWAPVVVPLAEEFFEGPLKNREPRAMDYTGASAGEGWLWTLPDDARGRITVRSPGELSRPVRVVDGQPRPELALPEGLPTEPRVTLIRPRADGGLVWAVEGEGLWDVDAAGEKATRRDSPTEAWRILDWRAFADGTEVVLAVDPVRRRDLRAGRLFVRREGRWIYAGMPGTNTITLEHDMPAGPSHFDWQLHDDLLTGAGFSLRFVALDLREIASGATPRVRQPGWREAFPVTEVSRVYPLSGGSLLIHGGASVVATPAELRAGWQAAERAGAANVHEFFGNPLRARDGRLWLPVSTGPGAPLVRHWDGGRWLEWPMPPDYTDLDYTPILWADDAGRLALFSLRLEQPAWERGPEEGGDWRRWESGRKLIEARAADPLKAATVPPLWRSLWFQAQVAADGRALVGDRQGLWLWEGGGWRLLTKHSGGTIWWTYGFGADGRVWSEHNDFWHVFEADGTMRTEGKKRARESQELKTGKWPDWLSRELDENAAVSSHQDAEGVWWVSSRGELWKGWEGEVARVFAADEPSPFRQNGRVGFRAVHVDATGARLFEHDRSVLLPAGGGPAVELAWTTPPGAETDREARVTGENVHFARWRIDAGEWRRTGADLAVRLRELRPGAHVVEARGFSARLEPGPIWKGVVLIEYSAAQRIAALTEAVRAPGGAGRNEAIRRLASHGAEAAAALRAALAKEDDEDRRWWLRAALQAVADGHEWKEIP